MAEVEVLIEKIHEIREHPNADRLELATIGGDGGYQCCVQKGTFKAGDLCIYFPVDSVLPPEVEDGIFGKDAKVKFLSKGRVRTIKLRGAVSQGMAIPVNVFFVPEVMKRYDNVTERLGVTKYEPPQKDFTGISTGKKATRLNVNPYFDKYTDINHLKKYPEILEGKKVMVFEKIHETNFRAGWVKAYPRNWFQRLLKRFGLMKSKWEFVYGSHNVQLQGKYKGKDFYSCKDNVDVYTKTVKQYNLKERLKPGEVIYGGIYGSNIQAGYTYGCGPGETKLVVFDLKLNGNFVDGRDLIMWCIKNDFEYPPFLYMGVFEMEIMDSWATGPSRIMNGDQITQGIKEGIVVRPDKETYDHCGRLIFKYINPEYLLRKNNSEYH